MIFLTYMFSTWLGVLNITKHFKVKKYSLKLKVILTFCRLSDFAFWVGEVGTIKNERKFTVRLTQESD